MYKIIHSPEDHTILQKDLTLLTNWAERWQMEFNIHKCKMMQITICSDISRFTYTMNNIPLEFVDQHNYLGVCLHNKLSWQPHVNQICHKANRQLGFLYRRNLKWCSKHFKEYAYRQIVLPSIQYCSAIWDPYYQNAIHKVEMIQHRAARFILNKLWHRNERDSITHMIFELSWPTLQHRRKFTRLTLLFKLLHQHLIIPDYCLPSPSPCLSTRNYNNSKFLHYQPRTNIYKYSFSQNYSTMEQSPNTEFTELDSFTI